MSRPVEEMTQEEKLDEILLMLRGLAKGFEAMGESPMGKMIEKMMPGLAAIGNGKR